MENEEKVQVEVPDMLEEQVIGFLIEKILRYEFDDLSKMVIVTKPPELKEHLHPIDRFFINRLVWKATLEGLYKKYLPNRSYTFDWKIEFSPYTLTLCKLFSFNEITEYYKKEILTKVNSGEDYNKVNKEALEKLGIGVTDFSENLKMHFPTDDLELYILFYRIMNFPPLEELALFYHRVFKKYTEGLSLLIPAFGKKDKEATQLPNFTVLEPLSYSVIPFSHKLFSKYGLQHFKNLPELRKWSDEFEQIHKKAIEFKDSFTGTFICSCCGTEQTAKVPIEILEYKFLLHYLELCKEIGYILLDEVIYDYQLSLVTGITHFLKNINSVNNPNILILVEGSSEEVSIPLLGFRKRFLLFQHKIFVYNSGSKEQLLRDFKAFKIRYPKLFIICLLDKDANKERVEISRMIKDKKNRYELIYLERGTWEDIFPLELSVQVLNELYPDSEKVVVGDFDGTQEFNRNIGKILFNKKKADFDKVKFAELLALRIDVNQFPQEVKQLFETAEKFKKSSDSMFSASQENTKL